MRLKILLSIGLTSLHFLLFAQTPHEQLQFHKYTVEQGLSQNIVEAIYQDNHGFMWFGTQDGLNRFDGNNFKTYYFKIDDSTSLSNNYVKCIIEGTGGDLWIGTYGGGLNRFDKRNTFERFQHDPANPKSISSNVVYGIFQQNDSTLWLGTREGLNKFSINTGEFKSYGLNNSKSALNLTNPVIYALVQSHEKDQLWLGTRSGLNLFDLSEGKIIKKIESLDGNDLDVRALANGKDGKLWIATKGEGLLYKLAGEEVLKKVELPAGNGAVDYVRKIYPNEDGSIWVGTFGEGLFFIDKEGQFVRSYQENNKQRSISDNRVVEIFKDAADNYWLGTHGGGINTFNLRVNQFEHYVSSPIKAQSLSHTSVNYIYQDKKDRIYVATDGGIDEVVDSSPGSLKFKNIIKGNLDGQEDRGWLIYEDSQDVFWVGIWNLGLSYYDRETEKLVSYIHDPNDSSSIGSNFVESIVEDSKGNLWVGLIGGGLDYFDRTTKTFKHYTSDNAGSGSLSNDRVHALTYDEEGDLWIGTDYGLDRYIPSSDSFEHFRYRSSDSLSINYNIVRIVFKDAKGGMWIGTGGGGLSKMMKGEDGQIYFKHYTTADGLPNNNISGIVEDDQHNLWITTYQGLAKFDPDTEKFKTYTTQDGLQGPEFIRRSAEKLADGRIMVGGYNGLNIFDPSELVESTYEPNVRLVKLNIFNHENEKRFYDFDVDEVELNDQDYLVSFEVAVTDYTSSHKNKVSYKLEGFDNEWVDNANRRHFSYTNLPAGDYLLKVRASNSDEVWSSKELEITLSVVPPFWQTLWFQILAVIMAGVLIFVYIRIRVYNLRKSKETLQNLVSERTREVEITNQQLLEEKSIVSEQKDQITLQHEEIVKQNQIIQQQNDELKLANSKLEEIVDNRTRELREANSELFASNHELDTFFYRAAHDLKGPVSTILGLSYLALKEDPNKHIKIYLEKVEDTAKRMSNILFNLQKVNKIKHTNLDIGEVKIHQLLLDALEDNIPDNTQKDQFIEYELVGLDEETTIYSDYLLLKIVFVNLFSNALKFSIPGEKTKVKIHFDELTESRNYRFVFEDFGVGIKEEYRNKIFDMFFIATDRNPGTGLGLYSVKMAVKKLGGSIVVDPSFDKSSGFLLQLPIPNDKE